MDTHTIDKKRQNASNLTNNQTDRQKQKLPNKTKKYIFLTILHAIKSIESIHSSQSPHKQSVTALTQTFAHSCTLTASLKPYVSSFNSTSKGHNSVFLFV